MNKLNAGDTSDLRITDVSAGVELDDISHLSKGIELSVKRDSSGYLAIMSKLEEVNLGGSKGVLDRTIVADAFFAKGVKPTLVSADKNVYNKMYKLATGLDPTPQNLGGLTVPQKFPNGFDVTVADKIIKFLPFGSN